MRELFITTQEKAQFFYIINCATYVCTRHIHAILCVSRHVPAHLDAHTLMHNVCMRVSRMMCLCAHTSRRDHMRLDHMMTYASRRDYMNLVLVAVLVQS